jgi:hypothetical protein
MNSMLIKPQALWYLYDFDHFEEVDDYLCRLGFISQSSEDPIKIYKGRNEALMISLLDDAIVQVNYKTVDEQNYLMFINYAKDNFDYVLIHEDQKPTSTFLRYDDDKHSLIFMVISVDILTTYTVILQEKLDQSAAVLQDISIGPPPKAI